MINCLQVITVLKKGLKKTSLLDSKKGSLIFDTTDAQAIRTGGSVHVGAAAVEVQVAGVDAIDRTAPVVAVEAHIGVRAIVVMAEICQNKL